MGRQTPASVGDAHSHQEAVSEVGIALLLGQLMGLVHGVILSPVNHLTRMGEVAHAGSG